VRAMLNAQDGGAIGLSRLFMGPCDDPEDDYERECHRELLPRGLAHICMPVRIPICT
jgi:hypothetical protein